MVSYNGIIVKCPSLSIVFLLLLGGLILNVAVAWGCALWSNLSRPAQIDESIISSWPRKVGQNWPKRGINVNIQSGFGITSIQAYAIDDRELRDPVMSLTRYQRLIGQEGPVRPPDAEDRIKAADKVLKFVLANGMGKEAQRSEVISFFRLQAKTAPDALWEQINLLVGSLLKKRHNYSLFVLEAGWPCSSLDAQARSNIYLLPWGPHAIQIPRLEAGIFFDFDRWIPLNPKWPGFLLNTLFYALLLWPVSRAPAVIHIALRRKAGLCPCCGTAIGVESECVQCGSDLREFWEG